MRRRPKAEKGKSKSMQHYVIYHGPSDSPGYTRVMLRDPVGHRQAGAPVVAHYGNSQTHEILLHGQREFDVPTGAKVVFPDGTEFQTDPPEVR